MIGIVILGIVLFIAAVNLVLAYICLAMASPTKQIVMRTVPRQRIPADWNRIMQETVIERRKARK